MQLADELHLDVLTETHSAGEIERAVNAGARIIGVNNRNLKTSRWMWKTAGACANWRRAMRFLYQKAASAPPKTSGAV